MGLASAHVPQVMGMNSTSELKESGKSRRLWQALLVFMLVLVVASSAYYLWFADSADNAPALNSVEVQRGNIEDVVTAQGTLEPKAYVDVGVQVSGQLKKIYVDIGDTVKRGDLIAEIDSQIYESRVQADQAKIKTLGAQVEQQVAQLNLARQKFKRTKTLRQSKAISEESYLESEASLKVSEAQLQAIKAQLEETRSTLEGDRANLSYTKIYAPMDGTVVQQKAREGQTLNANQSAPVIVQLADLDTMTVRAQVAEADIMRLKPNLPIYFTTLGSSDRRWQGKIRQILPAPETINNVVLYNVLVDVDNHDRQLMTGMSTQMFFLLGSVKDALVVPVAVLGKRMLMQDNEQGHAYQIKQLVDKEAVEKIVYIGMMDRTKAEVRAGLKEGDRVVAPSAFSRANQNRGPSFRGGPRL